jgi:hypothetical protein
VKRQATPDRNWSIVAVASNPLTLNFPAIAIAYVKPSPTSTGRAGVLKLLSAATVPVYVIPAWVNVAPRVPASNVTTVGLFCTAMEPHVDVSSVTAVP